MGGRQEPEGEKRRDHRQHRRQPFKLNM
jgi:hypothetical protein